MGSVDNLTKTANNNINGISDKDEWPLHHSPSTSSNGHYNINHDRQDSNEKMGKSGIYGSIAPALPPSNSGGSIRRNLTMTSSNSNGAIIGGGLNRADSMASSAHGGGAGIARSDSVHYQQHPQQQQQQYTGFYPGLPPPPPPTMMPQVGQTYHQGYVPQFPNSTGGLEYSNSIMRGNGNGNAGLDYSNSMRRPGGYEY